MKNTCEANESALAGSMRVISRRKSWINTGVVETEPNLLEPQIIIHHGEHGVHEGEKRYKEKIWVCLRRC